MLHLQMICGIKSQRQKVYCAFLITHVCSHFMDVQEANRSFSQQCRVSNYFVWRRFTCGCLPALQFWECVGDIIQQISQRKPWPSQSRKSHSVSFTFWQLCIWVHWQRSAQHSQQLPLNATLSIRRRCGSDPNDQQRTKPKLKARHKNAQSRFEVVVWESEIWIILFLRTTNQVADILTKEMFVTMQRSGVHCWLCGKSDDPVKPMTSAAFLANLFLAQPSEGSKRCLRRWHSPRTLTSQGVNTNQKYWHQVAHWMVTWLGNNWAIVSFRALMTRGIFWQRCSISRTWRETCCKLVLHRKSWLKKKFVRQLVLSTENCFKMHEAEVHVFSDSVLCMGQGAMNESEVMFTQRWNDYLGQYRESARRTGGEKSQFVFHIFLGAETNDMVLRIDEWIRQGQGEDGQTFTPETCPHRVIFMGMMNHFPFLQRDRKEVQRNFCKTRKEMQLTSESSRPVLHVHWSSFRKDL